MSIVIPSKGGSLPLPLLLGSLATQDFGQKGGTDARQTHKYANTNRQIHKIEIPKKLGKSSRLEEQGWVGVGEMGSSSKQQLLTVAKYLHSISGNASPADSWDKDLGTSQ